MRLSDKQISDYQQIYFDTFGERISKSDAITQGLALLRLVKVLSQDSSEIAAKNENNYEQTTSAAYQQVFPQ
jgi:hypothetical protein